MSPLLPSAARLVLLSAAAAALAGCGEPTARVVSGSLEVRDILGRCVRAYETAATVQARGILRDYRAAERRVANIAWDYARPDRWRLQIELDLAVVTADDSWFYDSTTRRFRRHTRFTRNPIETSAYLLGKGVPFLLPTLLSRGSPAFGGTRDGQYPGWSLAGVGWHAERPCYVLARRGWGREPTQTLRLWIDQDQDVLRGWAVERQGPDGREEVLLGCSYYEMRLGEPLPRGRFDLYPPKPILLPSAEPRRPPQPGTGEGTNS